MATATDYDAPRTTAEPETESLDLLRERREVPADDAEPAEYEVPGFEIVDEELTMKVIPIQEDEFRCGSCFLVLHRTMRASNGRCRDCA